MSYSDLCIWSYSHTVVALDHYWCSVLHCGLLIVCAQKVILCVVCFTFLIPFHASIVCVLPHDGSGRNIMVLQPTEGIGCVGWVFVSNFGHVWLNSFNLLLIEYREYRAIWQFSVGYPLKQQTIHLKWLNNVMWLPCQLYDIYAVLDWCNRMAVIHLLIKVGHQHECTACGHVNCVCMNVLRCLPALSHGCSPWWGSLG